VYSAGRARGSSYDNSESDHNTSQEEERIMDAFEHTLYQTDFSKYTDLKSRLAGRLFGEKKEASRFTFSHVSDEEAEYVNAAQGLPPELKKKDTLK